MRNVFLEEPYSMDPLTFREIEVLQRISEGSSNQDIADEFFLSLNTVKWHVRNIYEKLDVNSRTQALKKASQIGLLDEILPKVPPQVSRQPDNLPAPLSSLLGRDQDIKEVRTLLDSKRLLTLTGPGGVGKTRLALEVARTYLDSEDYPDGIYFIELIPVTRPERVAGAIVEGLKLSPPLGEPGGETLIQFLKDRNALLILDNFEHLLDAAPLVTELLSGAPDIKVLATSREALHLTGEQLFLVQPLEILPAQQLFIQRTREINLDFDPSEDDLILIEQICASLDHLPLAIELAAARMNIFSLITLLKELDNRFRILIDARRDLNQRHHTLREAIDWSCNLLTEEEQILFQRLSVFQGSCTIDAVQEVCCFDLELDALDGLSSLLAKNLICHEEGVDGLPRFNMLETIHEYTWAMLCEREVAEGIQRRHAVFFVSMAEKDLDPALTGLNRFQWLKVMKADHDNLRKVYSWSMDNGEEELALRLAGCLGEFWVVMGSFDEGIHWIEESLQLLDLVQIEIQARIFRVAGILFLVCCGDHDRSKEMYHNALRLYTLLEDIREMGWIHVGLLGTSEMFPDERDLALENFEKGLAYLQEVGDQTGIFQAWCNLGIHFSLSGNREEAREAFQESLRIAREGGDPLRIRAMLGNLGALEQRDGNISSARRHYKESILIGLEQGLDVIYSADILISIASIEHELDRPRRAAILLGAADKFYKLGDYWPQVQQYKYINKVHDAVRISINDADYNEAWAEGQAMTPEEAITYALEDIDDPQG